MKLNAGRAGLMITVAGWITFTLLLVNNGINITTAASQTIASSPMYTTKPLNVTLKNTNQTLTAPSYSILKTGREWSYVSKSQGISPSFVPPLTDLKGDYGNWLEDKRIQPLVQPHLEQFIHDAAKASMPVLISSAYRSAESQEKVRKDMANTGASNKDIEEYVAKPGHSEHQLGLAVDLTSYSEACKASFAACKLDDKTADWLAKHAHEYGFILRYPKGKEAITGVGYESWHFRYVGKKLAGVIHESGLTFDEVYRELVQYRQSS